MSSSDVVSDPMLWCLHIIGPDDVHPAPSLAHAELAAKRMNEWHAGRPDKTEHDPAIHAVAATWPHSAESHAAEVDRFIPDFLLPRWQVEGVPDGMVVVQRRDLEALCRFGLNNAGDGMRAGVKLAAMRCHDLLAASAKPQGVQS